MIRFLFSLFVSLGCFTAVAAQPLVTPAELAARLGDSKLRIVDIREGQVGGKSAYDLGHIAGAQHAPYSKWRGPAESPGRLPALDSLTALIQQLGIDRKTLQRKLERFAIDVPSRSGTRRRVTAEDNADAHQVSPKRFNVR